jgi:hypothetical protein
LLFPFLKEFALAASAKAVRRASEKFPRRFPGKAFSRLDVVRRCAINDYYAFVKNLPELRRFFETFF